MSWPGYAPPMQGFNLLNFMKPRGRQQAPATPHSGMGNMQPMQAPELKPQQGWWGGFKDRMNIDDQTLLMSGLGLLAGDRYSGPQMALQSLAYGMDTNKAEKKEKRFDQALAGMGMGNLVGLSAQDRAFMYGMNRDKIGDERYADQQAYSRGRDEVADNRWRAEYERADNWRDEDQQYRAGRDAATDAFTRRGLDIQESGANARIAALQAEAEQKAIEAAQPDVSGESALRKEFFAQNKGFQEVQRAYDRIVATDPTNAAGQMSLIFQYMKMMDPGSTVREGEFANAQNTTGIPGQVINAYNKAARGEYLNTTQVEEFQRQAEKLYAAAVDDFERSFQQYRNTAGQYEFDPGRTIPDLRNADYMDVKTITGDEDYDRLPSGALYVGPDGIRRRKP